MACVGVAASQERVRAAELEKGHLASILEKSSPTRASDQADGETRIVRARFEFVVYTRNRVRARGQTDGVALDSSSNWEHANSE